MSVGWVFVLLALLTAWVVYRDRKHSSRIDNLEWVLTLRLDQIKEAIREAEEIPNESSRALLPTSRPVRHSAPVEWPVNHATPVGLPDTEEYRQ